MVSADYDAWENWHLIYGEVGIVIRKEPHMRLTIDRETGDILCSLAKQPEPVCTVEIPASWVRDFPEVFQPAAWDYQP